jgi:hypothetical protein
VVYAQTTVTQGTVIASGQGSYTDMLRIETLLPKSAVTPDYSKKKPKIYPHKLPVVPDDEGISSLSGSTPPSLLSSVLRNGTNTNSALTNSPMPATNFQALADNPNIQVIPPDTHGAVGPNHIMTVHNSEVRWHTKNGTVISTVSLQAFWTSFSSFTNISAGDPRVLYDSYNQRWIMVSMGNTNVANATVLIATSQTNDPTGFWWGYQLDADANNQTFLDFPQIGFNKDWIVITGNMFDANSTYQSGKVLVLPKAKMYAQQSITYKVFENANYFSMSPATTFSNTLSALYLVQVWNGNVNGSNGQYRLYQITGAVGSENLSVVNSAINISPAWNWGQFAAPQLGSTTRIDAGDHRIQNVVFRNGHIWFSHTVFKPAINPTRSEAQFIQLTTTGAFVQGVYLTGGTTNSVHYAYPSIAVNANNDLLMGYTRFGTGQYASANYIFRYGTDALGTLRNDIVFKAGQAKYVKTFGGTRNRWGDYSATVVDPTNDLDMWTIQEYAALPTNGVDRWGTWWAKVDTQVPNLLTLSPADNSINVPITSNLSLTFNEPIKKGITGSVLIKTNGVTTQTIGITSTAITISGNTVTIDPPSNLSPNANVNIEISANALTDLGNNGFAGITSSTAWNFTTAPPPPTVSSFTPLGGAIGSLVTINGSNFTGATNVRFNGVNATFSVLSNTQIRATVPTGATTGKICVSNAFGEGCSVSNFNICSGSIVVNVNSTNATTYTANASGGTAPYTYSINGISFSSTNTFSNLVPGTKYTITARDAFGCTGSVEFLVNSPITCNTTLASGGQGTTFTNHILGNVAGTVKVHYEFYPVPDQMDIYYNGALVATTGGLVSGVGTLTFNYNPIVGGPNFCTIRIYAPLSGTAWDYLATCPAQLISNSTTVTSCNTAIASSNGGNGIVGVTGGYANNENFTKTFVAATAGQQLRAVFTSFETEPTFDKLQVYDGTSTSAPLIGEYSGFALPPTISSNNANGALTFRFITDAVNTYRGFFANISCSTSTAPEINVRQGNINVLRGGTFNFGTVATMSSSAPVIFTVENLGGSPLLLTGNPKIIKTGTAANDFTIDQVNTAGSINSGGTTTFAITFTPSSSTIRTASISIANNDSDENPYTINLTGTGAAGQVITNGNLVTCGATILDPGGFGDYPNGSIVQQVITPATTGNVARITFTSFNLEAGYDFLSVYNGSSTSAPLIGIYTGTTLPPMITATNLAGQLTLRFTSDNTITRAGFIANVTCAPPPIPTITSFSPTIAAIGATVTIFGSNFLGTNSVKFNGVNASFTVVSNTSIQAVVPVGATTGPISVTNVFGTGVSANFFTVNIPGMPTITSFTPTSGAWGTLVTINGTNFTGATSFKFNGLDASFTIVSATQIVAVVPNLSSTGKISVTNAVSTAFSVSNFTVVIPIPTAPTNLVATAISSSQIRLNWTDNSNTETGFRIEMSINGTTFTEIGVVGSNITQATVNNLGAATTYFFRVRATTLGVNSLYSNTANAKTSGAVTITARVEQIEEKELFKRVTVTPEAIENKQLTSSVEEQVLVYPNPFDNEVNIRVQSNYQGKVQIVIYNAIGMNIGKHEMEKNEVQALYSLDLSQQAHGTYFIQITEGDRITIKKIVK